MTSPAPPATGETSVATGSAFRFAAEAVWAVAALVTGAIVGRQLGPDGKGITSTLGYLVALVGPLCALGLGEASVTMIRQGTATLDEATVNSAGILVASSVAGMGVFVGAAVAQFHALQGSLGGSIAAGAITVPLIALNQVLTLLVESQRRFVATSASRVVVGVVTTVAMMVLVLKLHRGVAGAVLAGGIGFGAGALVLAVRLLTLGVRPRFAFRRDFAQRALRIGVPIQLGFVLVGVSARADLLLVEWFRGGRDTGLYSVGLTFSQLVSFAPAALGAASFPVLAGLGEAEVSEYADRILRVALAAGVVAGAVVAAASPVLVPAAFGAGFRSAVLTTVELIPSGLLYSQQWVVCRTVASRGNGRVVLGSFLTSASVMVLVDLALVPHLGNGGAALGGAVGALAGLAVALRGYAATTGGTHLMRRAFVPGRHDLAVVTWRLRRRLSR